MTMFRSKIPQVLVDLGTAAPEYQVTLTLTPEQVRSLNTFPVSLVPGTDGVFLLPERLVFVGALGTVSYSANPNPLLQYTGGVDSAQIDANTWTGLAATASVSSNMFSLMASNQVQIDSGGDDLIGRGLELSSGGDVTGGDALMTVMLTYSLYVLTDLL